MGLENTWKRIKRAEENDHVRSNGCPNPHDPKYYSYTTDHTGAIIQQRCANVCSSLNSRGRKAYRSIQHYSIDTVCTEASEALCVRSPHKKDHLIVTRHAIGECPLCNYHTEEEYIVDWNARRGINENR